MRMLGQLLKFEVDMLSYIARLKHYSQMKVEK